GWGEGKIGGLLLFGVPDKKDPQAKSATQKDSLVPQAIRSLKEALPDLLVTTDVCLCAYTDHGHCGLLDAKGDIQNDASLEVLAEMALRHAEAGADMVAPSDMLDGRIKIMRKTLDENGFSETPIMSYAAKYASAFYGPFRDAAHSAPAFGDRKSYQMNPANIREAMREMAADVEEGADILMVKPAGSYLDVIAAARQRFDLPIAAYQVSGEYSMIKAAAQNGWIDEKQAVAESLLSIKRAGADIIITYFAPEFRQ
ncbi:MAG: porphobilinogen synthase, partial [Deltaproteobacteria bacterium]|nr:porphobilinogen synthase [Deltaproteobacteria bacterium]